MTDLKDRIKILCGISDTSQDTLIENMIKIYRLPILQTVKEEFYESAVTGAIVKTGICEIIAGQVLNAIARSDGEESISLSSFSYKRETIKGDDLIKSGYNKLAPFAKDFIHCRILSSSKGEDFFGK